MTTTPNMGLVMPDDHGSFDLWGGLLNAIFANRIDLHDHTPGLGVPIKSSSLRIDADVPWAFAGTAYAITGAKAFDFAPVASATITSYAGALFLNGGDGELYYRTLGGSNVKITNGAALNVAAFVGGIGGDYSAVGALESYDDATDSYWFQQEGSPRPWARIRTGDVDIYQTAASIVNRIRLRSPNALAASYEWVFPGALPAAQETISVNAAGVLSLDGKHGDRFLIVDGSAFRQKSNSNALQPNYADQAVGTGWNFFAPPNDQIRCSVPFPTGTRIKSITWYLNKRANAAGMFMQLATIVMSTQVLTDRGSTNDVSSASAITTAVNSINYTLLTGESCVLGVQSANTSAFFYGAIITYDRP